MDPLSDQPTVLILRYRRSKALAFAVIMLGIGSMIGWVAWDAFDPACRVPGDDGALLQALPAFARVAFFMVISLVVLAPGAWMLWAGLADLQLVNQGERDRLPSRIARPGAQHRKQPPGDSRMLSKQDRDQAAPSRHVSEVGNGGPEA